MSEKIAQNNDNEQTNTNITDKILPNNQNMKNDIMQFKNEILREIKLIKKSVQEKNDLVTTLVKEKFTKYDNKFTSHSDRISELSSNLPNTDDLKKDIDSLKDFKNKFRDSMLTMDIKINNMDKETKNSIFRIDNLLTDSIIYPGIIGKAAKFKTFHQMIDYILSQTSQNLTYREKNTLDVNQIKKKISTLEQNMQTMKDNISKEIDYLLVPKLEENDKKLEELIKQYDRRLTETRAKNIEYIENIKETARVFKDKLDEFDVIKNKIKDEIREEGKQLFEENQKTQNIFKSYKKDFNLIKDRFTQLSEFIKDVRFRINVGKEVQRREYYQMSGKIDFSKKQKVQSEKNINIYNTKYQNDSDLPDFLQSHNSPRNYTLRNNNKNEENTKNGQYSADIIKKNNMSFFGKNKNKGRNTNFNIRDKDGRNYEFILRENKTSKTNKTSEEFFEDNETDRIKETNNSWLKNKHEDEKERNHSDIKLKQMIKRRNTYNIRSFHIESFKKIDTNKFNLISKDINNKNNSNIIQEIMEDSNINQNRISIGEDNKINNSISNIKLKLGSSNNRNNNKLKNYYREINDKNKNRYKIVYNKNINKEEMLVDSKKNIKSFEDKTPKSKIFNGLNNRTYINKKNKFTSLSERNIILSHSQFDENLKMNTPKSKPSTMDNNNVIESKKNSQIFFAKKTTVKNLVRIQSALTQKYPTISNNQKSLKRQDSLNKTSLEEEKMNNIFKNKNIKKEKGVIYISNNKNLATRSPISPNVKILQHSVEPFNNNFELNDITGMVANLQKYINGFDSYYVSKNDIRNEQKRMVKNSDYYKFKQIINGNNNNRRSDKNRGNQIKIGINAIK